MSQIPLINEAPAVFARYSPPREPGLEPSRAQNARPTISILWLPHVEMQRATDSRLTGRREDDVSKETEIKEAGAVCLSCGSRPETPTESLQGRHFRPVEWE
jgi:hypothetical protein